MGIRGESITRHNLTVGISIQAAITRIDGLAICTLHLQPALTVNCEVKLVVRVYNRSLDIDRADRRQLDAKSKLGAFWNEIVSADTEGTDEFFSI